MKRICVTDHYDMEYPGGEFSLDTASYLKELEELGERYAGRLEIRRGVELGLQPHLGQSIRAYTRTHPFDYVIGSVHLVRGLDPYDRDQYPGSDRELYREYFACTLENIRSVTGFQALGHLDYVVRYGHGREKEYSYRAYADVIDEILRELICRGNRPGGQQRRAEVRPGISKSPSGRPEAVPGAGRRTGDCGL